MLRNALTTLQYVSEGKAVAYHTSLRQTAI